MKNKLILLIYFTINLYTVSVVKAGGSHLLPQPQKFTPSHTSFQVNNVQLSTPVLQQEWEAFIAEMGGTVSPKATTVIDVKLLPSLPEIPINQDEAYRLNVTRKRITVEAVTERGVYWAMQTLRQLAEKRNSKTQIQGAEIVDWPAFRIRGFMQDVATYRWKNSNVKSPHSLNSKSTSSIGTLPRINPGGWKARYSQC